MLTKIYFNASNIRFFFKPRKDSFQEKANLLIQHELKKYEMPIKMEYYQELNSILLFHVPYEL